MSKEAQSYELTYDLIKRAVHGEQEAIEAYLLHYDAARFVFLCLRPELVFPA